MKHAINMLAAGAFGTFILGCLVIMFTLLNKMYELQQQEPDIWQQYHKCLDESMLLPTDLCGCAEEVYLEDHFDGNPDEATQRRSFERCVRLSDSTDQSICDCAQQVRRPDWCY